MVHRPNIDPNLAFVLIPFRSPFDSYYDEIIRPAAKSVGLEVRKADEIYGTGPIIHDIWKQIWAATVVIADVTGKNANVNYELGMCRRMQTLGTTPPRRRERVLERMRASLPMGQGRA